MNKKELNFILQEGEGLKLEFKESLNNLDKELVRPTKYDEYFKNKAKRPQYSDMKSEKNIFYPMKTFKESLSIMKSQIPNYK